MSFHPSRKSGVDFEALSGRLLEHTAAAVCALDATQLGEAYALLERLCQQYVQTAVEDLEGKAVPRWHHQLLLQWFKEQSPQPQPYITSESVLTAHPDLWPEVKMLHFHLPQ